MRRAFLERAVVELVYKFDEKFYLLSMFEKVSRSLKYDSNIFIVHKHIYYMDTTVDHFTPLALCVRGNNMRYIFCRESNALRSFSR